jgi:pimeloyl-ACP methyl ester carboxylesterase
LFWHGDRDAQRVVLAGGGALGGVLGPANGLFHDLGKEVAAAGFGWISVGYRRPNDLDACVGDLIAAGMLAERSGAESLVTVGHSFGGAVAIGAALPPSPIADLVQAVVTLSTQSAGCEQASLLAGKPLLLFHGDRDEILPAWASVVVSELAGGHGEVRILPGAGHLLTEGDTPQILRSAIPKWVFDQVR